MARSTRTMDEFYAQAMLLGMMYDIRDHTMTIYGSILGGEYVDADDITTRYDIQQCKQRYQQMNGGRIGPCDAPLNGDARDEMWNAYREKCAGFMDPAF